MRRWFTLLGITAALALGLTVAVPVGAVQAASAPPELTFLPDVAKGAKGLSVTGVAAMDYYAIMMQKFMASPAVREAAKAKAAGVALSASQSATLATQAAKWSIPTVPFKSLTKFIGPVGAVLTGGEMGFSAGKGVSTALGLNTKAGLCEFAVIGVITSTDCTETMEFVPDFVANAGTVAYPPGFTAPAAFPVVWGRGGSGTMRLLTFDVTGYSFGEVIRSSSKRYTATGTVALSGECKNDGNIRPSLVANPKGKHTTTGAIASGGSIGFIAGIASSNSLGTPCGNSALSFTLGGGANSTVGTGLVFDHVTLTAASGTGEEQITSTIEWYPPGHALWTPGKESDPDRLIQCEIRGTDGITYRAESLPFKETDGGLPEIVCPKLPAEVFPAETTIWEIGGGEKHELYRHLSTPEFAESATMPECMDGSCLLVLRKNDVSCFDLGYECAGWFTAPDKQTTYTCRWGNNAVPLERCTAYAPTFKPDANTKGQLYGDPVTGAPLTNPTGAPDQVKQAECFPTGWGVLNPFEWVLKPVGCALAAAFVPKVGKVDQARAQLDSKWQRTTVAKYVAAVGVLDFGAVSGCQGIAVNMSWLKLSGVGVYYFLPACPGDFFAGIAPLFKVFIGGSLVVGGFIAVTRQLGAIFGYRGIGQGD